MNQIIDAILSRRSIRKYTDEPVSPDDLNQIIQCGLYAANGGNHQVVHLTALARRDLLDQLTALVRGEFLKMPPQEELYQNIAIRNAHNRPDSYDFSFHAPVVIIAGAPLGWPNGMADSASALQNMQVAASALGLGACWVNQLHWLSENPVLRNFLQSYGIGQDEEICGSIVLGHPAGPKPAAAPRKDGRVTIISE